MRVTVRTSWTTMLGCRGFHYAAAASWNAPTSFLMNSDSCWKLFCLFDGLRLTLLSWQVSVSWRVRNVCLVLLFCICIVLLWCYHSWWNKDSYITVRVWQNGSGGRCSSFSVDDQRSALLSLSALADHVHHFHPSSSPAAAAAVAFTPSLVYGSPTGLQAAFTASTQVREVTHTTGH